MTKMDELMKEVNKQFNEEVLTLGLPSYDYTRIPFTSPRMNYCTFGGLPVGKITEFFGKEYSGKTTSALDIVANYQHMQNEKKVLYVDAENKLNISWAKKLGVDIDDIYILQPKEESAEEIFETIYKVVNTGEIGLWVLDSIGVLLSQQEWEKEMSEKTYGGVSMPLTKFGKKIIGPMARNKCTGIGINQLRDDMNSMWGGTRTPGGRGWKFNCSVRLEFNQGKFLDEKGNELTRSAEQPAGNIVQMSMVKNSTCPPSRRLGQYRIMYDYGIDYIGDLIDVAIKYDIIDKHGAWFTIIDIETGDVLEDKIQGQANLQEYLQNDENIKILKRVEELVDNEMKKD